MTLDYVRTHFYIENKGIAMSPEFQKRIWDNFAREETGQVRHIAGTGSGTAISRQIIDL